MAILTLSVEDIGNGLIRIQVQSDTNTETAPITPAMAVMALVLDFVTQINTPAEIPPTKDRVH